MTGLANAATKHTGVVCVALSCVLTGVTLAALTSSGDVVVTDRPYVRHDGGTDATIASCSSDATTPEPFGEGGGNRTQNEPAVAINPRNTQVIVASANDGCTSVTIVDGWLGFYVSRDGGATWMNSLNPGTQPTPALKGANLPSLAARK